MADDPSARTLLHTDCDCCEHAKVTIDRLSLRGKALEDALKPFARLAEVFPEATPPEFRVCGRQLTLLGKGAEFRDITLGDLRRALAALTEQTETK